MLVGVSLLRRDAKQQGSHCYEEKYFFFTLRGCLNPAIFFLIVVIPTKPADVFTMSKY